MNKATILFLFLLASCREEDRPHKLTHTLKPTDSFISLPLSKRTPPFTQCAELKSLDDQLLYFYMGNDNNIVVFDLDSLKERFQISIDIEGENGIGELVAFSVHSLDSIYTFGLNTYEIDLIDSDGKVTERYSFLNNELGQAVASSSFPKNKVGGSLYKKGNYLFYSVLPDGNWTKLNSSFFASFYLESYLDVTNKRINFLPMTYPEGYYNHGDYDVRYHRIHKGDSIIYSFASDHKIYVANLNGKLSSFLAKSQYLTAPIEKYDVNNGIDGYLKSIIEKPRYRHILWDQYREVYYRFVNLGAEVNDRLNTTMLLQERSQNPTHVSILILDKHFKMIGESRLENNTYLIDNYLILPEGLYLSTNNPSNPSMSEVEIRFEKFELVSLD